MTDVDTGALGPSGRFARMEASLERIESKLDLKADVVQVVELKASHEALKQHVNDMVSGNVRTALSEVYMAQFTDMKATLDVLEEESKKREAVAMAVKERADARFKVMSWVVGGATTLNVLVAIAFAIVGQNGN